MRILAVGDLHTKGWIIDAVKLLVDSYDAVVFVGDYADNWNTPSIDSISTWLWLKKFMDENPKVHAVIGNHDFAYIHPEISGRSSGWSAITMHQLNDVEGLKDWLLTLPVILELDGISFSHAGITEEWNGKQDVWSLWDDSSPIWARPREFGGRVTYKNIPQVIGHNPSETIWQPAPGVWCIDTFSEYQNNKPIGDYSVLEIIDKKYKTKKLNANHSDPSDLKGGIS